jgi:hypothetical protein
MRREASIDYYDTRFIKIDEETYIRQIKPHWYSSWKIVVKKNSKRPIIFKRNEVKYFWHGRCIETCDIGDGSAAWKWDKYDLM